MGDEQGRSVNRRGMLGGVLSAGAVAAFAAPGTSAAPAASAEGSAAASADLLDRLAIGDLVQRERAARDAGMWKEMAACWHPRSHVEVSWFRGDGASFVAASKRVLSEERLSQHQLGPTVATTNGSRAIAETPCQLMAFITVDGAEVCVNGTVRLVWRASKAGSGWLISGLRMIYIRDLLVPCVPGIAPSIDVSELARHRRSYRFLSYALARSPNPPRDDLPGIDRPASVAALRAAEAAWLQAG